MNNILNRIPPHSIEAEQLVLGILIVDETSYLQISDILGNKHFYNKQHQVIYSHIEKLKKARFTVDAITVSESLKQANELDYVSGNEYLNALVDAAVITNNIEAYANLLIKYFSLREIIHTSTELIDKSYTFEGDNVQDIISKHINQLTGLSSTSNRNILHTDDMQLLIKKMQIDKPEYIETNDSLMDKKLGGGLVRGELVIVAAKSGMGKTATAINLFSQITLKHKAMYFSIEMSNQEILRRLYSNFMKAEISSNLDYNQQLKLSHSFNIRKYSAIIDNPSLTISDIRRYITEYKLKHGGIDVIFIDYLQIMQRPANMKEYEAISQLTRELKILAQEFQIAIICLSQLSRSGADRKEKRPLLSDLRGSGSIEQDADIVIFLHREEYYYKEQGRAVPYELVDMMELIIAKFRRYIPSKLLYHCDVGNNILTVATQEAIYSYANFLKGNSYTSD